MANNGFPLKSLLWALGVWCAHLMSLLVVIVVFVTAIQREVDLLVEMDAELPAASVLAISLSAYIAAYWYTLLLPVAVDAAVLGVIAVVEPKLNWLAWLWSTLWLLGLIFLLGFATLAIALPLTGSFKAGLN